MYDMVDANLVYAGHTQKKGYDKKAKYRAPSQENDHVSLANPHASKFQPIWEGVSTVRKMSPNSTTVHLNYDVGHYKSVYINQVMQCKCRPLSPNKHNAPLIQISQMD